MPKDRVTVGSVESSGSTKRSSVAFVFLLLASSGHSDGPARNSWPQDWANPLQSIRCALDQASVDRSALITALIDNRNSAFGVIAPGEREELQALYRRWDWPVAAA